ncbi:MAG: class I SAM-dependent methyltransferase [Candidatus Latescibacterota bacterium]|jgi:demethylmenaquinone methyltransferase/2-methoxy-6-polyprenyl-1,4-benzoquinol methylase
MSSYAYMKVLESTPQRYDRGIRILSRGAIGEVYQRLAELVGEPGSRVMDVGCGTGNVALACAARGADVVGIDLNAGMLEVARAKSAPAGAGAGQIEWMELGALEIEDRFPPGTFDGAASCLLFSELTDDEQDYLLATLISRVRPGGTIAIADEVAPKGAAARAWWRLRRAPLVAATWLLAQTSTRPVCGLENRMRDAGFSDLQVEQMPGDFVVICGRVPAGREP